MVYLEAWAYRKPVIGARIASVSSLIENGRDGYLIDPTQTDELAARLATLYEQRELAQALGLNGRAKLERRYTLERIADIVEGRLCPCAATRRNFDKELMQYAN